MIKVFFKEGVVSLKTGDIQLLSKEDSHVMGNKGCLNVYHVNALGF